MLSVAATTTVTRLRVTSDRAAVILITLGLTVFFGAQIGSLHVVIDSKRMVPASHPYQRATNEVEDHFGASQSLVTALSPKDGESLRRTSTVYAEVRLGL